MNDNKKMHFNLIDSSFKKKLKPIQNLSLIITSILWVLICLLLLIKESPTARTATTYLIIISALFFIIFCFTSLLFLYKPKTGFAFLDGHEISIGNKSYKLEQLSIVLNVEYEQWVNPNKTMNKKIINLPYWNNYLVINNDKKFEFEPNIQLLDFLSLVQTNKHKEKSMLMCRTSHLLKDLLSILWASS